MTKTYDAKTILTNLCWDVNRMLLENRSPEEVLNLIESRLLFLKTERSYEVIKWWK
jgi:hypothetical protein